MKKLIALLKANKLTISCCESVTGGLFASSFVSCAGASSVFKGGLITYQTDAKRRMINQSLMIIERYGVVSLEMAELMAKDCQQQFASDIAVSFTGNAGPDVLENKPVGFVISGLAVNNKYYYFEDNFVGSRQSIRNQAVNMMINRVCEVIKEMT